MDLLRSDQASARLSTRPDWLSQLVRRLADIESPRTYSSEELRAREQHAKSRAARLTRIHAMLPASVCHARPGPAHVRARGVLLADVGVGILERLDRLVLPRRRMRLTDRPFRDLWFVWFFLVGQVPNAEKRDPGRPQGLLETALDEWEKVQRRWLTGGPIPGSRLEVAAYEEWRKNGYGVEESRPPEPLIASFLHRRMQVWLGPSLADRQPGLGRGDSGDELYSAMWRFLNSKEKPYTFDEYRNFRIGRAHMWVELKLGRFCTVANTTGVVEIDGTQVLGLEQGKDGKPLLHVDVYSSTGEHLTKVWRNSFTFGDPQRFELTRQPDHVRMVDRQSGRVVLDASISGKTASVEVADLYSPTGLGLKIDGARIEAGGVRLLGSGNVIDGAGRAIVVTKTGIEIARGSGG